MEQFQNMRYALPAKATKASVPEQVYVPPIPRDDQAFARNLPPTPQLQPVQSSITMSLLCSRMLSFSILN